VSSFLHSLSFAARPTTSPAAFEKQPAPLHAQRASPPPRVRPPSVVRRNMCSSCAAAPVAPGRVAVEFLTPDACSDEGAAAPPLPEQRTAHAKNKHWVFVYGTLKRGFANHSLLSAATYIGEFRTSTPYPLVVGGAYFSPYLLDIPDTGARVLGEVYAVCDDALASLDVLENVGVNYTRRVLKVLSATDRSFHASAYAYLKCNFGEDLLEKPVMDNYQCRKYVPRHRRPRATTSKGGASKMSPTLGGCSLVRACSASETGMRSADSSLGSSMSNLSSEGPQNGGYSIVAERTMTIPAFEDHPGASLYAGSAESFHASREKS
jgi:gamma-glutamylaminecyclotransferase